MGSPAAASSAKDTTGSRPEETEGLWSLPARTIGPPIGASDVIAASVRATPQPDIAAAAARMSSEAAMQALVDARDADAAARVSALLDAAGVTVTEESIAGVGTYRLTPSAIDADHADHELLYVHGGAYVLNAGTAGLAEAVLIAARCGMSVVSVDYRMPPAHPFPAGFDDVAAVWAALSAHRSPTSLAMGGASAGAGLVLAVVQELRATDRPVPGALFVGTPWSDLTRTGDSYTTNEGVDRLLISYDATLAMPARLYAGSHDMTDRRVSPVHGDFDGFPPTMLVTGTRDLFLSNTARVHTRLRQAGVEADLFVFEGVSHGDYALEATSPEHQLTYSELHRFLLRHLTAR